MAWGPFGSSEGIGHGTRSGFLVTVHRHNGERLRFLEERVGLQFDLLDGLQIVERLGGTVAADLGVEVEFYPDEFRYLIPDLLDNRFDVIISNLSISTNRAMQVNFSAPYNSTDLSLIANRKLAGGELLC